MGKIKGVAFNALIDDLKRILWCLILFYGQDNIDDGSFWKKTFEDSGPLSLIGLPKLN